MPKLLHSTLLSLTCLIADVSTIYPEGIGQVETLSVDTIQEVTRLESEPNLVDSKQQLFVCSPLRMPEITSPYGMRRHPVTRERKFHNGVDLTAIDPIVMCVYEGKVVEVGKHPYLGRFIRIDHGGIYSIYGHLSASLAVAGDTVSAGQSIGIMGQTGRSTGIHLHFSIRIGNRYVDPIYFPVSTGGKIQKQ